MKPYYQTTPEVDVEQSTADNIKQEDRIHAFMLDHFRIYTAWDLHEQFPNIPITSIRRSLFNLKESHRVAETGYSKGKYGKPVGEFIAIKLMF